VCHLKACIVSVLMLPGKGLLHVAAGVGTLAKLPVFIYLFTSISI